MSDYGVKNTGFIRKRQDTIKAELQQDISDSLGINVAQNPQSYLNVLLTTFANRIAQLWEVAEGVYFSQFVSTADGVNLDFAAEAGGMSRKDNSRTKYTCLCTGTDGTTIPKGARIASTTSPKAYFAVYDDMVISRLFCNRIKVRVLAVQNTTPYTVTIGETAYTITSGAAATEEAILNALQAQITDPDVTATVENGMLTIAQNSPTVSMSVALSDNLTAGEVGALIVFQSVEYGSVVMPEGTITEIATAVVGFDSVTNVGSPTLGAIRQTDEEYRHSYLQRIASRSTMMIDSISSAIMENVSGAKNCTVYENATSSTDAEGRPPHSIEVVVQGGSDTDIAQQILNTKPVGIQTYGSVSVDVPDLFDSVINVKFNRPTNLYTWIKVIITPDARTTLPSNYVDLIKGAIMDNVDELVAGESILSQSFLPNINAACAGVAYADIYVYGTTNSSYTPTSSDFTNHNLFPTSRQLAICDPARIEVVLDD